MSSGIFTYIPQEPELLNISFRENMLWIAKNLKKPKAISARRNIESSWYT